MISIGSFVARVDSAEYRLCRRLNRGASIAVVCWPFRLASRLGDGIVWYALIVALPVLYGPDGLRPALGMALTGMAGLALYTWMKRTFVRERPFITHAEISLAAAPLDRYSFPSGHTLHAASFTWQAVAHFPELGWVLVPLAALIGLSRIVLGLHYPTDVLVGAGLGIALGATAVALG